MQEQLDLDISNFRGVTIVGDVHGNIESFRKVIRTSMKKKFFIIALGDLIDHGDDSLPVMTEMGSLLLKDRGISIKGNHEFKFQKYLNQLEEGEVKVRLRGGVQKTLKELDALSPEEKESRHKALRWTLDQFPLILNLQNLIIAHAAIDKAYWEEQTINKKVRQAALYGELDRSASYHHPIRIYNWVKYIPNGKTVIVGHACRSELEPIIEENEQGGTAIFLDGGSSKGGSLFSMDFKFDEKWTSIGWKMN